jgi:hypothetical protein
MIQNIGSKGEKSNSQVLVMQDKGLGSISATNRGVKRNLGFGMKDRKIEILQGGGKLNKGGIQKSKLGKLGKMRPMGDSIDLSGSGSKEGLSFDKDRSQVSVIVGPEEDIRIFWPGNDPNESETQTDMPGVMDRGYLRNRISMSKLDALDRTSLAQIRSAKSPIKLFSSLGSDQGYNCNNARGQPQKYFSPESPSLESARVYNNDLRSPEKLDSIFGSKVETWRKNEVTRQKKQFDRFINYSSVEEDFNLPAENSVGLFSRMGPTPDSVGICPDSR